MLLLSTLAIAAPCNSATPHLALAQIAVLEADLEATAAELDAVEVAWGCAHTFAPVVEWQRYALIRATLLHYRGDVDAESWFAIASELQPEEVFGPTIQERVANARGTGIEASIQFLPPLPSAQTIVDGWPYEGRALELGPHLVQLLSPTRDRVADARVIDLRDDRSFAHQVSPPTSTTKVVDPLAVMDEEDQHRQRRHRRRAGAVITALGSLSAGIGIVGSLQTQRRLKQGDFDDPSALDATVGANRRYALLGYGGLLVAGTGVVLTLPF